MDGPLFGLSHNICLNFKEALFHLSDSHGELLQNKVDVNAPCSRNT